MNHHRHFLLTPALLLSVLASCRNEADAAPSDSKPLTDAPPPLVEVAALTERPVRRFIETTSYLESEHRVSVMPRVSGQVEEVLVDEGQKVKKGELLARLDDREVRASVRASEVLLQERRVRLELMQLEQSAWERRIEQARIERDKARSQHQRNLEIDPGLISEKELEDSEFALQAAEEALLVSQVESQKAALDTQVAQSQIDQLEATLESERVKLSDHQIQSPIRGVISRREIRGGETVSTTTELFVVVDEDNLVAYLWRPQRELALIQSAKEVTFTTDAVADQEYRAGIDMVSPVIDETTGSFRIRVRVVRDDDQAGVLRPGMFVRARIMTEEERPALMVPKAALLNEGTQSIVFLVRDGVARRVVLLTGLEERDYVECKNRGEGGLRVGDLIVVSGQQGLRDNVAVEVAGQ